MRLIVLTRPYQRRQRSADSARDPVSSTNRRSRRHLDALGRLKPGRVGASGEAGCGLRHPTSRDTTKPALLLAESAAGAAASTIADLHRYRRAGAATVGWLPSGSL